MSPCLGLIALMSVLIAPAKSLLVNCQPLSRKLWSMLSANVYCPTRSPPRQACAGDEVLERYWTMILTAVLTIKAELIRIVADPFAVSAGTRKFT